MLNETPRTQASADIVCYFFFKDDNEEQKSAINALRALLHQIYVAERHLVKHAMAEHDKKSERFVEELGTLWNILIATAKDRPAGNIVCIIDALDECEFRSRHQLMDSFVRFHSAETTQNRGLKILVTGRPYLEIERGFATLPAIRLKAELELNTIDHDIELVVRSKIRRIGRSGSMSEQMQCELETNLLASADRTFLWVSLILELLERSPRGSKHALQNLIDTLPEGLDAVYEKILTKAAPEGPDRDYVTKLLHLILGAARPLSLEEMNIALAISPKHKSESDLAEDLEPQLDQAIRGLSGLFVRIIDDRIYLVHQTAKEFLLSSSGSQEQAMGWKHSFGQQNSDRLLAAACLRYLTLSDFENSGPLCISIGEWPSTAEEKKRPDELLNEYLSWHKFLDYAARNWASHFQATQHDNELTKLALVNCRTQTKRFETWFGIYWGGGRGAVPWPWPPRWTDLHVGAYLGLEAVVELLLREGFDVEIFDCNEQTMKRLRMGYRVPVKAVLDAGASTEFMNAWGRSTLSATSKNGLEAVVKLSLDMGAHLKPEKEDDQTPLCVAAAGGQQAVVALLLRRGPDVNTANIYSRTLLMEAIERGDEVLVQLLLELKDSSNRTPLYVATLYGHQAVTKLLLQRGANVNTVNIHGRTPLMEAAKWGDEVPVQLLLEHGADPNPSDGYGDTALTEAAEHGHDAIIRILLEYGANLEVKNIHGRTPQLLAAELGRKETVKLLLAYGADPDAEDNHLITPLSCAAAAGHEEVAKLLLAKGARINSCDRDMRTPLSWAAENGRKGMVQLLLAKSADPNAKDREDKTPLMRAQEPGRWGRRDEAVVTLLQSCSEAQSTKIGAEPSRMAESCTNKAVVELRVEGRL
ncbi:hypothetical protein W97_05011 [Coniosporium apollinis CBS 100218]|uniref:Uncharacterized protein n=1 Tax=Coniosporium apollinis (strain CBS 100218) TaxID=1168221 RepID=R7YV36_CONA1|nr:uncharacterized protein W97_05011 [Coniosporium apollinis CBS 100218]EON65772.1 hypothetical protein W97_05011 [Coniosporium apollinis CBS 100218]